MNRPLILASASPRRTELLKQIGLDHKVLAVDIDETPYANESALCLVERLANQKAIAAQNQLNTPSLIILAADTIVSCQGRILGKPRDEQDAIQTLLMLSEQTHQVTTAFCILADKNQHLESVTSTVTFGTITEQQAAAYWLTNEPVDKAGSYAIQGQGAMFVKTLLGSYSNVVGLPLYECHQALSKFGVRS